MAAGGAERDLKIFTPQQNDDGADNVLLGDANIFLTYTLYLFDAIEKSTSVLERILSNREEKNEEKLLIYILLSFAIKKKKKKKERVLYCTLPTTLVLTIYVSIY